MSRTKLVIRPEQKNRAGECVIYVKYTHHSLNTYISTKEMIAPSFWDSLKCEARRSLRGHHSLNDHISSVKEEVDNIVRELRFRKKDPTAVVVKETYKSQNEVLQLKPKNFFECYENYIQFRIKEQAERNTVRAYKSFLNILRQFQNFYPQRITYEAITLKLYDAFLDYRFNEDESSPNTVGGDIKQLKSFMAWSVRQGHTNNKEYEQFRKPSEQRQVMALTETERDQFANHDLASSRLTQVRDAFIFSCYTGLRFSDYSRIRKDNIRDGKLHLFVKKTKRPLVIPLHNKAADILEKYDYQLAKISNQKTNEYLKEAATEAGLSANREVRDSKKGERVIIQKPLSELIRSHFGRSTFITIALEKGIPAKDIMAITGHASLSSFQRYMATDTSRLAVEIKKI